MSEAPPNFATCKLCLQNRTLRNSHIIPEPLYEPLYNAKGLMLGVHGIGKRGAKPIQKGLREYLFCEQCEQYFNEYFEKPFREEWIEGSLLPNPWNVPEPHCINVDYKSFKLFHLSVFFRASVSTLPEFSAVSLGKHQERMRQMLLARDPGPAWQYPIFGLAVYHHKDRSIARVMSQAQSSKFNGVNFSCMIYGGVQWWMFVTSHRDAEIESVSLRPDGTLPLYGVDWRELGVVQSAAKLLRGDNR